MKTTTAKRAKSPGKRKAARRAGRISPGLNIRSILVPTDFSAPSEKALGYAAQFARQFGAKLTLLHVVEPVGTPDFAKSLPLVMDNARAMNASRARLEQLIKSRVIDPGLVERTVVRFGRSFHEIAAAARSLKADLIVIATHGYAGLKHVLLGSTTERVVRHASCPVLVVRERGRELV